MKMHFSILFICVCCLTFSFKNKSLELTGAITSEHGFVIPKTYVQLLENGEIIAQTKTDNFGKYTLLLPKIGKFTLRAGYKSKFFHQKKIIPAESVTGAHSPVQCCCASKALLERLCQVLGAPEPRAPGSSG